MKIKLTSYEIIQGALSGILRQVENLKNGRVPAHGAGDYNNWQIHVEGALGELALAKYLRVYWSGKGEFRGGDVGSLQVRTSGYHNGHLLLHHEDNDDDQFWFVTGVNGVYVVRGWIYGFDGKKEEFWREDTGRPAFFVPQSALLREI